MPTLYVVATPIGNLDDITVRAMDILRSVPIVAAEDTRITRRLLTKIGAKPQMISIGQRKGKTGVKAVLKSLGSGDVALVSDAGTPAISDPGAEAITEAKKAGYIVSVLPGPSAPIAAVALSGFGGSRFLFLGFVPRVPSERVEAIAGAVAELSIVVFFEAPHRLRKTLSVLRTEAPARRLCICRELTKIHEEVFYGTADEALQYFTKPLGEFTIVMEGGQGLPDVTDQELHKSVQYLIGQGFAGKTLVEEVTKRTGVSRTQAYRAYLKERGA